MEKEVSENLGTNTCNSLLTVHGADKPQMFIETEKNQLFFIDNLMLFKYRQFLICLKNIIFLYNLKISVIYIYLEI